MSTIISARVEDQALLLLSVPKIASGGANECRVEVLFDDSWKGYGKTAIFYRNKSKVYHVVMTDGTCIIPHEVMAEAGRIYFGIMGVSGSVVRTTEVVALAISQGAITGVQPVEPMPDVYKQLLSVYGQTVQKIDVQTARLDVLAAGGTSDGTEVADIRVGYDGKTYGSAGTAVREQIEKVAGGVDNAKRLVLDNPVHRHDTTANPSYSGAYYQVMTDGFAAGRRYLLVINSVSAFISQIGLINSSGVWEHTEGTTMYSDAIRYGTLETTEASKSLAVISNAAAVGNTFTVSVAIYDVTDVTEDIDDAYISLLVEGCTVKDVSALIKKSASGARWYGKKALVIGDSLTAAGVWQKQLVDMLGMTVTTHAKGGIGIVQCVDGSTNDGDPLYALNENDVADKDLILFFAGYNNRGKADGKVGDCYNPAGTGQDTIAGALQYAINRIYEELKQAGNLTCRVAVITPHCAGKYAYIDADGYDEYPAGSGRTMKTLAQAMEDVANHNALPCYNAWKHSGINRNTWAVYASSSEAASGKTEQGTGGPYYWNADQLHLNKEVGYPHLGACIAQFVGTI